MKKFYFLMALSIMSTHCQTGMMDPDHPSEQIPAYVLSKNDKTTQHYEHMDVLYHEQVLPGVALNITSVASAKRSIWIDAKPYKTYAQVLVEMYDWDGDFQADSIRITNWTLPTVASQNSSEPGVEQSITFYHGPRELRHIIETSGHQFSQWRGKSLPAEEMGVISKENLPKGLQIKPIVDKNLQALFALGDRLVAHSKTLAEPFAQISDFPDEIQKILDKPVLSYPTDWQLK